MMDMEYCTLDAQPWHMSDLELKVRGAVAREKDRADQMETLAHEIYCLGPSEFREVWLNATTFSEFADGIKDKSRAMRQLGAGI